MEVLVKASWALLAALHLMPALVLFSPSLTERLYDVSSTGEVGLLVIHRGAMFLGIVVACLAAALDPNTRRAMSVIVAISVVGFLFTFWRGGMPGGALRTVAIADLVALAPLGIVSLQAWRAAPL